MSQSSSVSTGGDVYYADPNAAKSNWLLWAIGGVIIVVLVVALKGKKA